MKREYKELLFTKAFTAQTDAERADNITDRRIAYARQKAYEDVISMLGYTFEYNKFKYDCFS